MNSANTIDKATPAKTYRNPLWKGEIRNKPCICNGVKKIKRCHGSKYELSLDEMAVVTELIKNFADKTNEMKKQLETYE